MSWRDQIDNAHFVKPSAIEGKANGSDALKSVLHPLYDHEGHVVGLAAPVAARSYNAMVAGAWAERVVLRPSSSADTFRPLSIQQRIFTDRYRETDQGNGSRVCGGKRWYKRKGVATAACPGTSNHGLGCAVDFDLDFPGSLGWLEAHAKAFGWQWEVSSEDWHLHYMLGDQVTQPVLDHEADQSEEDDMTKDQEAALNGVLAAVIEIRENVRKIASHTGAPIPDQVDEDAIIKGVLASLTPDAIAAAIPDGLAADVADELAARLKG